MLKFALLPYNVKGLNDYFMDFFEKSNKETKKIALRDVALGKEAIKQFRKSVLDALSTFRSTQLIRQTYLHTINSLLSQIANAQPYAFPQEWDRL